jgi:hypothetical protein
MPGTAKATDRPSTHKPHDDILAPADRAFLLHLQRQALSYFVDNQAANGLMLDRQANHGPVRSDGLCSTAATGMGFIALALASAPPHALLSPAHATTRIAAGLEAFLQRIPHDEGAVPHFIDSVTGELHGVDHFSTVETAWVVAGALWAAAFLQDGLLESLAARLNDRVNWHYWTAPEANGLLHHGKDRHGRLLVYTWDRMNGETAFLYVLAAGTDDSRSVRPDVWSALRPFYGTAGGLRFNNADLGLFVFQYGLDLLDLHAWQAPGGLDLAAEARVATGANRLACHALADRYATYQRFWGLSAGDGPGDSLTSDIYRCYAPSGPIDGTAHITATLASVAHEPALVLENLYQAQHDRQFQVRGRYGFSTVNVDQSWVSRDMIGIDAGSAVLGLDNYLMAQRVRTVFHSLPAVRRGLTRLGFGQKDGETLGENLAGQPIARLAS